MSTINIDCLYNYWIHSYEEDEQRKKVYRTSDFKFPPSFGRDAFNIKKSGEIVFSFPGKDDRQEGKIGRFQIKNSDKIDVDLEGKHLVMTILSCETDRLVIIK